MYDIHWAINRAKTVGSGYRLLPKFWPKLISPFKNTYFQSIFACSASAVTPSEKLQLTRIRSPLWAFQWV